MTTIFYIDILEKENISKDTLSLLDGWHLYKNWIIKSMISYNKAYKEK